ncbi:MAG: hypothetical protein PHF21_04525, partial [Bacilli bacterium]|nr:hypothetical protein [Bacilli bacterium]
MNLIIDYFITIFLKLVDILSSIKFLDFPLSLLDLMLGSIIISFIFKLIFGGMKDVDTGIDFMSPTLVSKGIGHFKRKQEVNHINRMTTPTNRQIRQFRRKVR